MNKIYFTILNFSSLILRKLADIYIGLLGLEDNSNSNHKKNILIVFVNAIGDFVLFTSIIPALRQRFESYNIVLLGYKRSECLYSRVPYFDEYLSFDREKLKRNLLYRLKLFIKIRRHSYEMALYPAFSRNIIGDLLIANIKAKEKIGFVGDTNNISLDLKKTTNTYFTRLIEVPSNIKKEIYYYWHLAKNLKISEKDLSFPQIWYSKDDLKKSDLILKKNGITDDKKYIVLFPGAASEKRIWNPQKYAKVCDYLFDLGYDIVINGIKKDKELAQKIIENSRANIVDLTGKTDLIDLVGIFKKAVAYIGSETGPLQIAVALDISTICIMGGGHAFRFYPYNNFEKHRVALKKMKCFGCNWKCIFDEIKCINDIEVEDVLIEVKKLFRNIM